MGTSAVVNGRGSVAATIAVAVLLWAVTVSFAACNAAEPTATKVEATATVHGQCWETRCQRDHWPVDGCVQYGGTVETKRVPCDGGYVYTCCGPTDGSEPNLPRNSCGRGATAECRPAVGWLRGPFDGCSQLYGTATGGQQSPCADGYDYVCCENADEEDSSKTRTGSMTYFHLANNTACGKTYSDYDMVGSLGPHYFTTSNTNDDPLCGRKVKIVDPHSSKSVVVSVVDKCGGCSINDIMVSPAAFKKIKPLGAGRTTVKWAIIS